MFRTKLTNRAYVIACFAHRNQKDKAGFPYIMHPMAVAEKFTNEKHQAVALLHDVLEDSDEYTPEMLMEDPHNIPRDVVDAVVLLTHKNDGLTYIEYIQKIKDSGNKTAIDVKLADLEHNMDMSRLPEVTEEDLSRLEQYEKAYRLLKS